MGKKRTDPVVQDQGGRSMPVDPLDPISASQQELVRVRAYEIYEQSGKEHGREIDHWLAAEQQVTAVQE